MRLVVDTSVLVGDLLRSAGRERLGHADLELFMPEAMWDETQVELPRRISMFARRRGLDPQIADTLIRRCREAIDQSVVVLDEAVYGALQEEALARSRRDPADWPVVAAALALSAAIWTNDNDFLGCGVATWTTDTLQAWLDRQ